MVLAQPPSAEAIAGNETCATCHEDVVKKYAGTRHGKGLTHDAGESVLCESCHGPGKEHAESEGDKARIKNPKKMDVREGNDLCLNCHAGDEAVYWRGTTHESFNVSCTSCHELHQGWSSDNALKKHKVNDLCLACHTDVRKSLYQRLHIR
ncbi:MAG: cytochrome c3 family protein [Acidobacteriota bacterium]